MILQNKQGWAPLHDRTRQWLCHNLGFGDHLLRFYAVLAPGEDLSDYPPTIELTDEEWSAQHEDIYGLDPDGRTVTDAGNASRDVRDIPGYLPS